MVESGTPSSALDFIAFFAFGFCPTAFIATFKGALLLRLLVLVAGIGCLGALMNS
jgi:hypothetical protein